MRSVATGWIPAGLIVLAVVLGGGAHDQVGRAIAFQILAAVLVGIWCYANPSFTRRWSFSLKLMLLAMLAVPLLQLVPLPPALWHMLPGREMEVQILSLVGRQDSWRPVSMLPFLTLYSLFMLLLPVAVMALVAAQDDRARRWVAPAICGAVGLGMVVSTLARTAALEVPLIFGAGGNVLYGFQANRNVEADLLLVSIPAFALAMVHLRQRFPAMLTYIRMVALACVGGGIFAAGVLLTGSRMGLANLLWAGLGALAIVWSRRDMGRREVAIMIAGGAIAIVGAGFLLVDNALLTRVLTRADLSHEVRWAIWSNSWVMAKAYWPLGTGFGTYFPMYQSFEPLTSVDVQTNSAAHLDYLQLAIEGGLVGALLFALVLGVLAVRIWKMVRYASEIERKEACLAVTSLVIAATHSFFEFPLRSLSFACVVGAAAALLFRPLKEHGNRTQNSTQLESGR